MAIPLDPTNIQALRDALSSAYDNTDNARFARRQAQLKLAEVSRSFGPGTPERVQAEQDLADALVPYEAAEKAERDGRAALSGALQTWLQDDTTHAAITPDQDFARLTNPSAPVVLFPLRAGVS